MMKSRYLTFSELILGINRLRKARKREDRSNREVEKFLCG